MKANGIFEKIKKIGKGMKFWVIFGIMALALFSGVAGAAIPVEEWNRTYGGNYANSVQQVSDGSYIIAGNKNNDFWLTKTNSNGNEIWNKTFGGTDSEVSYLVKRTFDNGYIMVGQEGTNTNANAWVIKTDSIGNEIWNKTIGGINGDIAKSIQQTTDNSYIITGYTYSYGAGEADVWLIKIDSNGNEIWNKTFGGSSSDYGSSVQQTTDGGYIITGQSNSNGDVLLIKTNSDGNEVWNKTYGDCGNDFANYVQQTTDGGYIIAGNKALCTFTDIHRGGWLIKTNSNGTKQWDRVFDSYGYWDSLSSVEQTSDNGYIAAGIKAFYILNNWNIDANLIKFYSNGSTEWEKIFGGANEDKVNFVQQTSDGGYILAGDTTSFGSGERDAWLIKVSNGAETPTPISAPNPPTDLAQLKSDETTPISIGGTTNEIIVVFKGRVSNPYGIQSRLEVELRGLDENNGQFNESLGGLKQSELVPNGSIAMAAAVELNIKGYHWRARTVDANGNKSEWQGYGGNPVSEADFTVSVPDSQNFKLAHITDPHLGYYLDLLGLNGENSAMEKSVISFTDILQDTKNKDIDFMVVTGDIVQHREPEFFMAFKNLARGFTVYATPGNHDRRQLLWGNDSTNYRNIINPMNPVKPGEVDWNFSHKGVNFIGFDSGADYNIMEIPTNLGMFAFMQYFGMTPESDGLTDSQWNKLNNGELSPAGQRQIIFMHSPVMNNKNDEWRGDEYLPPVPPDGGPGGNDETIGKHRGDLIQYAINSNNKVAIVVGGHTHRDEINDASGSIAANTSANRPLFIQTRNNAYRIIEVSNEKINPYESVTPQGLKRTSSAASFSSIYRAKYGLHAYDSEGRHTGMVGCTDDFELGIPDSYYTGNYQGTSIKPEVLVGYSSDMEINKHGFTEYRILSLCIGNSKAGTQAIKSAQVSANSNPINITFNQTITDQNNESITEVAFYNVALEENSSATVNISGIATDYRMEVDLTRDGIVDQVEIPDSISVESAQPRSNISISTYDGTKTINLSVSSGNITGAGNMNSSMFPAKQFYEFPHGLISVTVSDMINGSTVNMTIELPENIPTNSQFWEYGRTSSDNTSRWYRIPFGNNNGDNVIILQLQDGGVGDDDGIANGIIVTTGGHAINSMPGISGAVIDSIAKTSIAGATVSINGGNSTMTDAFGFYSLAVGAGTYNLKAKLEPTHYMNNSVAVSTVDVAVAAQDIELVEKPKGNIRGNVRN